MSDENLPKKKRNGFNLNIFDSREAAVSKYKNHPSLHANREVIYQN